MRAASHGETLIRSRSRKATRPGLSIRLGCPRPSGSKLFGYRSKAVGELFVAIGSRKNLIHGRLICRWSYSQSDALIISVAAPASDCRITPFPAIRRESSGAGATPEQPVCEQAVAFSLGGLQELKLLTLFAKHFHIQVAVGFDPILVDFDRQRTNEPQATLLIRKDSDNMGAA